VIAITSRIDSTLAKAAEISLVMPTVKEACPHGLAPTTSTVIQLAVGDCLAVALLQIRQFTASDFKVYHPGGSLGASLLFVGDVMHKGNALPLTGTDTPMSEALVTMTEKKSGLPGCCGQ
jgi:arabinose-5-phosphate isomerase